MSSKTTPGGKLNYESDSGQLSWILTLPNELMCIVLAVVAETNPPLRIYGLAFDPREGRKRDEILGFLRLSEVCTRFRAVLLSMPMVWANIVFDLPIEPSKLALARSRSAPLPVYIHNTYTPIAHNERDLEASDSIREYFIDLASENAARLSSFKIYQFSATQHRRLWRDPLLMLKVLDVLYGGPEHSVDLGNICVNAPVLQRAFFLFMENTDIPFFHTFRENPKFNLPALQWLRIEIVCPRSNTVLQPRWIVNILRNSPLLKHLTLIVHSSFIPIDWKALFNDRIVKLVHIQSLELRGTSAANLPSFWEHLGFCQPTRCIADFSHSAENDANETEALLSFVKTFSPLLHRPAHDGLLVDFALEGEWTMMKLRTFTSLGNSRQISFESPEDTSEVIQLSISYILPADSPVHRQIVNLFVEALNHNKVKQLAVCAPRHNVRPFAVDSIVLACTAVAELVVRYSWAGDSADVAFPISVSPGALPALDSVLFCPIRNTSNKEIFYSCWEGCIAWLAWRVQAGLRVHRLCILGDLSRQDASEDEGRDREERLCVQAAGLVDDFVDERA